MNIEMEIFFFWYSTLIQWAGETQLSIQSIMTLILDEIALREFFIPKR